MLRKLTFRRSLLGIFAASCALVACGSASSGAPSSAPVLEGATSIRVEQGAGGLIQCPEYDGLALDTVITIDLTSNAAERTVKVLKCLGSGVVSSDSSATNTTSQETSAAIATPAQMAALTSAIDALSPHPSTGCGADGDSTTLTVDRGDGAKETYITAFDLGCEAPNPIVDDDAMTLMFTAANGVF